MLYTFLPTTTFKQQTIIDITKSVKLSEIMKKSNFAFVGLSVPEGDSPETVAFDYYEDASLAWLVLLANQTIDPYYQWPISQLDFRKWMVKKYGSLELSQSTILFYEHKTKNITISKDTYDHSATLDYINAGDYSAVYAYDYYDRINDNNRHIVLVSIDNIPTVVSELENIFGD
jgi:hypothetical protein